MENSQQIDVEGVKERLECDDEFLVEIWTAFKEESVKLQRELAMALEAEDLPAVERHAHSFKGMSANIGAEKLQSVACDMELSARGGDILTVRAIFPVFVEAIRLVTDEIEELVAKISR